MDVPRNQDEFKHVCKLCYKRFPSGKSLGGHMRSHVIAEARKNKLLLANSTIKKVVNFVDEHEDEDEHEDDIDTDYRHGNSNSNNNNGYGLRENPKKTWRIVDSSPNGKLPHGNGNGNGNNLCKQCGKGFNSLKALCGHMSIHSEKDKNFRDENDDSYSWSSDSIDQLFLAIESHSDNNNNNDNITSHNSNSKRQTRSSLYKYNNNNNNNNNSFNNNCGGSSSNHSEVDQLEQEEVALCLMMLSRDCSGVKNWFSFGPAPGVGAVESSDNNSVILEGGRVGAGAGAGAGTGVYSKNVIENVIIKNEIENSDSGYFENGAKEIDSDASVGGIAKNYTSKRKIRNVGNFGYDKYESIENNYCGKKMKPVSNGKNYECWICSKSYKSHQALGGHIISHRRDGDSNFYNGNHPPKVNPKTLGTNVGKKGNSSKKVKGHKCPYCPRVFKSGQALGGHKRSHLMGSNSNNVVLHSERLNYVPVGTRGLEVEIKQPLLDLNLPAPLEEDGSGNSQFVAW